MIAARSGDLFRHVSSEKAAIYRAVLDCFAAAKRAFRLHLRPDDLLREAQWPGAPPSSEELAQTLDQLVAWGNLRAQADTARVSTLEDFYRRRLLYRLTVGGEAVEAGLVVFAAALARKGELQTVALDDILARLTTLQLLAADAELDAAKVHEALRDLVHVFEGLARHAETFMADLARTLELQRAELDAVMGFKTRLIDYLERFIRELVERSGRIAVALEALEPSVQRLLQRVAEREAGDAAPDDADGRQLAFAQKMAAWAERWSGFRLWFLSDGRSPAQAELLRAAARSAIPRLLSAVSALNERRAGRSDRSADFRRLAVWFAQTPDAGQAHRLWRAAFGLSPARHLALAAPAEVMASTPWGASPPLAIHPRLREQGRLPTRGGPPPIRDRSQARALLAAQMAEQAAQLTQARERLVGAGITRLSQIGELDAATFRLFLNLLGEALSAQSRPDRPVERSSADGLLRVRLTPLIDGREAVIETELGRFAGRDHLIEIAAV
ncbi:TIGR02677 family protein [Panacagrimonas sp.]|uniref:TIGR02677 family protein n=1 Tax=Panacagrimonas sp. TaxID=2480088 RepID=UPI003B51B2CC